MIGIDWPRSDRKVDVEGYIDGTRRIPVLVVGIAHTGCSHPKIPGSVNDQVEI